ncbi:hypothetical protein H072_2685 [Dactylellina haptotyla CBS 200.50]|uniref:ASTRA-associated protein 1 n=1 Tax=Dactylellina haptotyla (strain CBS 200.50) TaxID=1284197 RepID=S8C6G0_DACHA|nr:hypothetical protein H072_2685 [Dactylellina haptotyla CBS 200.50]
MPMALKLFYLNSTLTLLAGYESGHAVVFTLNPSANTWSTTYSSKPHSQPVLSLDYDISSQGSGDFSFYTSSADSILAKHQVSPNTTLASSPQSVNTHHAGQQGLVLRSDGKIIATAGWDSRIRIYSANRMEEVAVLKWHKEGCYTVTFAHVFDRANGLATGNEIAPQNHTIITVAQRREQNTRTAHILAAGSKDGRISLWEVF